MTTITRKEVIEKVRNLENGQFFTVVFIKRTTGEQRTMNCRQKVTKHLRGGSLPYSPNEKGLVPVWDAQVEGYRSFPLDGITQIRTGGQTFVVE
jgi:hypothetical protein